MQPVCDIAKKRRDLPDTYGSYAALRNVEALTAPIACNTKRPQFEGPQPMADSYEVVIKRGKEKGTLHFHSAGVTVETTCWWDPKVMIDAAPDGYLSWKTNMATKKDSVTGKPRPGIWLGKGIKYAKGTKTSGAIFLHEGKNAAWSDGCIVCDRTEFLKMWNAISPNSQPHVLVKVSDE